MTAPRPFRKIGPSVSLGPFHYGFRPSPEGLSCSILIRATSAAPIPALGEMLILTLDDCYDADFEVTQATSEPDGWWVGCERRPRPL